MKLPAPGEGPHLHLGHLVTKEAELHLKVAYESAVYCGGPDPRKDHREKVAQTAQTVTKMLLLGLARLDLENAQILWWNPHTGLFVPFDAQMDRVLRDYAQDPTRIQQLLKGFIPHTGKEPLLP